MITLGLDNWNFWFDSLQRQETLLHWKGSITALVPNQPPIQWLSTVFSGGKVTGTLQPTCVNVKNEWNHTSAPSLVSVEHTGRILPLLLQLLTSCFLTQFVCFPGVTTHCGCIFTARERTLASSLSRFLDHTQRRATVGRTPLEEWSIRRRDLYLTTHNTHNRQTSGGIRTHSLSRRAVEDLRLRPRGHWDRLSHTEG